MRGCKDDQMYAIMSFPYIKKNNLSEDIDELKLIANSILEYSNITIEDICKRIRSTNVDIDIIYYGDKFIELYLFSKGKLIEKMKCVGLRICNGNLIMFSYIGKRGFKKIDFDDIKYFFQRNCNQTKLILNIDGFHRVSGLLFSACPNFLLNIKTTKVIPQYTELNRLIRNKSYSKRGLKAELENHENLKNTAHYKFLYERCSS